MLVHEKYIKMEILNPKRFNKTLISKHLPEHQSHKNILFIEIILYFIIVNDKIFKSK